MKYDVAVVGAGPAGAWTAHGLSRRGARVLLIDPSHPREKPCGGGVTGRALQLVSDAVPPASLPAVTIRSARFTAQGTPRAADVALPGGALVVASRTAFDRLLLDAAVRSGAQALAARAIDVRRVAGGFAIDTTAGTYDAAWLVGADGANSLVRRRLASMFRRDQLSMATGYYARGITSEEIAIELVGDPPGYLWSFPRPDHLAIGVCAQADERVTPADLRNITACWIERTGIGAGARLERYSWPIPSLSAADFQSLQPAGPGWLLVGDAAGLVDPVTREGIYFALLSGEWAAETIASRPVDAGREYTDRVRSGICVELATAARLKHRFFLPQFSGLMIEALRRSASVRDVMADLVAGRQGYQSLRWRLLRTFQFGLAARLLYN